jgi:hypothetical protein
VKIVMKVIKTGKSTKRNSFRILKEVTLNSTSDS